MATLLVERGVAFPLLLGVNLDGVLSIGLILAFLRNRELSRKCSGIKRQELYSVSEINLPSGSNWLEYENKSNLHIDASEFDNIINLKNWFRLEEQDILLSRVVNKVDRESLVHDFDCLKHKVDIASHHFLLAGLF